MVTSNSIQKMTRDILVFKTDISTDNDVRNVAQLLREESGLKSGRSTGTTLTMCSVSNRWNLPWKKLRCW